MLEIKEFWANGEPTIEDIEKVFKISKEENVIVKISWFVKFSGDFSRHIFPQYADMMSAQEYYEKYLVPNVYHHFMPLD